LCPALHVIAVLYPKEYNWVWRSFRTNSHQVNPPKKQNKIGHPIPRHQRRTSRFHVWNWSTANRSKL